MDISVKKLSEFIQKIEDKSETDNNFLTGFLTPLENLEFQNIFNNLQKTSHKFFYWEKPDENITALCFNPLIAFKQSGKNRAVHTEKEILYWQNKYHNNLDEYNLKSIPLFVGGMKFSPDTKAETWNDFADSDWFIPAYTFLSVKNKFYLLYNFISDSYNSESIISGYKKAFDFILPSNGKQEDKEISIFDLDFLLRDQDKNEWKQKVNFALEKIKAGEFQKIVLSRQVKVTLSNNIVLYNLLKELSEKYSRCYIFAYRSGKSIFFGASPERLAKIKEGIVEADALAGSMPRGNNEVEDQKYADELLASKKNLAEQRAVVEFIVNSFSHFSDKVEYNPNPVIRKLSNIQHLWTPIKARLNTDKTIFSILKEIHPTPAICGVPWDSALTQITNMENYSRGLYAGIIGWFNFDNEGEFAVAIRSALLKDNQLLAFAGCGIVDGSNPDEEYEETKLKLKPILSLFENENIYQS